MLHLDRGSRAHSRAQAPKKTVRDASIMPGDVLPAAAGLAQVQSSADSAPIASLGVEMIDIASIGVTVYEQATTAVAFEETACAADTRRGLARVRFGYRTQRIFDWTVGNPAR